MKVIEIDLDKTICINNWYGFKDRMWKPSFRNEEGRGHLNIPLIIFISWF